jgi:hypothetical protein
LFSAVGGFVAEIREDNNKSPIMIAGSDIFGDPGEAYYI